MTIDHITASINPAAIYSGVYSTKGKPYAVHAEKMLAKLLQDDASSDVWFNFREEGETRAAIIEVMESFKGQEVLFREIATKAPKLHEITMRRWLNRMASDGALIKRAVYPEGHRMVTYQMVKK